MNAFKASEATKMASISTIFENIFDRVELNLQRQMKELNEHIRQYREHYPISSYE